MSDNFKYKKYTVDEQQRLLAALAEQLKLPVLQIAHLAELSEHGEYPAALPSIRLLAGSTQKLIEHYLLSLELENQTGQQSALEPVSLSAVLHETAHELQQLAHLYHCDLVLDLAGHYEPVMAHPQAIQAALISLGTVFIEAQSQTEEQGRGLVTLAAHRSRWGLVAGAYTTLPGINAAVYKRAQALYGRARQPLNQVFASNGAGVFVADALFGVMSSTLHSSRYHRLNGLAATLKPVHQLRLI